MKSTAIRRSVWAPAILLPLVFASMSFAGAEKQQAAATSTTAVSGQEMKAEGVIVKRDADTLTLRSANGSDLVVVLNDNTEVKEKKINPFRSGRNYATTQLLRGLSVEVKGRGDGAGRLVAEEIKMKDDDLRIANSVETRVDPIENRLDEVETKLVQSEQNAQRLSGQVDEVAAIAKAARSAAKAAQDTGDAANQAARDAAREGVDAANAAAREANERISSLDDYEAKQTTSVLFSLGSASLTKEARAQLDAVAEAAKTEKGYMIEVTGYASADGDAAANERLSQRRADAVVRYLTENHEVPLRRLVTPFGFGETRPVADNATREGRRQNRRVDVKILVNQGMVGKSSRD